MKTAFLASLALALLVLAGCGGSSKQRTVSPEVEYAEDTKAAVLELQSMAKRNMRDAKEEIAVLAENFESYEQEPLGENKATYDAIVTGIGELKDMMSGSASKQQILEKVDELAVLANELPGGADSGGDSPQ